MPASFQIGIGDCYNLVPEEKYSSPEDGVAEVIRTRHKSDRLREKILLIVISSKNC